jgi:Na+-transporting NADH:ubiquinone oxidoreductase subunit NqrE
MIQRIQTVFLFLAIICLILFNYFPYWIVKPGTIGEGSSLMTYGFKGEVGGEVLIKYEFYPVVAAISLIAIIIAIIEVFKYKNRSAQLKLAVANSFLMSVNLAIMTYFVVMLQKDYEGSFGIGIFILAFAMIMNILARRFIQKDERLVRSVDRLR